MSGSNLGLGDTELLTLLNQRFGTKKLLQYYLRLGGNAAARARIDLTSQNSHSLSANAQTMIDAIEMMTKLLGDDSRQIEVDIQS